MFPNAAGNRIIYWIFHNDPNGCVVSGGFNRASILFSPMSRKQDDSVELDVVVTSAVSLEDLGSSTTSPALGQLEYRGNSFSASRNSSIVVGVNVLSNLDLNSQRNVSALAPIDGGFRAWSCVCLFSWVSCIVLMRLVRLQLLL